jgi:flagellar hook-associated protein 1 FlgK
MSLGIKAMAANYAALQTTGHNIANANVAGYSRQQVELATSKGQFTGAGFFCKGVDVVSVLRQHDAFLTGEAARTASTAAMDAARLEQLKRMEEVFKTGEQGLGAAVSQFTNSLADLTNQPADIATRQVVLTRAAELSSRFSEAGGALDDLQAGVTNDLAASVTAINSIGGSIAAANQKIAALKGLGQPANDLLDERDRLISQLSNYVQVSRVDASDGTVGVFVAGGQRLVLGAEAAQMAVVQDANDPRRSAVGMVAGSKVNALDPQALGGSVGGLLRFQNSDLVDGRNLVGRLAAAVGNAVNQQQMRGLNLTGAQPAPAMFAVGRPLVQGNANNAKDAGGVPLASVKLSFGSDVGALRASDYDLREDPATPGNWKIARLIGGLPSADPADTLSFSGQTAEFQGLKIDIGSPAPATGDRFRLQPVARAANDMATLLGDPRDVAAAAPVVGSLGTANLGTATLASLTVTASPLPYPGATARITFVDNSAADPAHPVGYTWEVSDPAGAVLASDSTPRAWVPGSAMPDATQGGIDINGFTLQLSGVPKPGDTLDVSPTPTSALATNNGNARALLALRDAALIDGKSATDGYAQAMSDVGVRIQAGRSGSDISTSVAAQAEQARNSQSGVNLDEEAARLIQYQQSYQAAAKMLQVAQSLFDTLLQTAGR